MIGLIITGHAGYAQGMQSALELITGDHDHLEFVKFDGSSVEQLTYDLNIAFNNLNDCDHILVLTDILGGTPFQTAVILSNERSMIKVIGGANLGIIIEATLTRSIAVNFDEFVRDLVLKGRQALDVFESKTNDTQNVSLDGDGI